MIQAFYLEESIANISIPVCTPVMNDWIICIKEC